MPTHTSRPLPCFDGRGVIACDTSVGSPSARCSFERQFLNATNATRRLREGGASFLQIKDRLRRSVAIQLLVTNRLSVEAISAWVGFADLTTFYRAFKNWTGTTPLAYQRSAG